jgi:hypothetical protein
LCQPNNANGFHEKFTTMGHPTTGVDPKSTMTRTSRTGKELLAQIWCNRKYVNFS